MSWFAANFEPGRGPEPDDTESADTTDEPAEEAK